MLFDGSIDQAICLFVIDLLIEEAAGIVVDYFIQL